MSKIEQFTEELVKNVMNFNLGVNDFGCVYPQGSVPNISKIETCLKQAGGKPKECELDDYSQGGNGNSKPEFIITFKDDVNTLMVIECKNKISQHESKNFNKPKSYAIDGVLYYAKFLKNEYNIIAVGVSGTDEKKSVTDVYYWAKKQDKPQRQIKLHNILLTPKNYLKAIKGERITKAYSLDEIRETALEFHDRLREIKLTEKQKPIFIAGILIALENKDFVRDYVNFTSFNIIMNSLKQAISEVLDGSDIKKSNLDNIKNSFSAIGNNPKLRDTLLEQDGSIRWYIEQLEMKIKPMMNNADYSLDALGVFYHEFVKYSGGDGSGLGIVLTPQHLTEFMCDLAQINQDSRVVDICCGSGSFLVTAMNKMFKDAAHPDKKEQIRKEHLYGIELDQDLYVLSIANMIIRKDGKSNIIHGDCFNHNVIKELSTKSKSNIDIGLLNPPYSQKDKEELEFVEQLLSIVNKNGKVVVVVPMACAIGTKFKETRRRLFERHTLEAVFSMPDDIFYPVGTNVCVMVWTAHKPHDSSVKTFFGYYKDDGFIKRKKLGRVDVYNKWNDIKNKWLRLYFNSEDRVGLTAKQCVKHNDEWLCEAYMKTDYTKLIQNDFEKTVRKYLAHLVYIGIANLSNNSGLTKKVFLELTFSNWNEFDLGLFKIERGKRLKSEDRENGNVRYYSASEFNNGMTDMVSNPIFTCKDALIYTTFGDMFYVDGEFTASDEISIFSHDKLNKYNGLFIAAIFLCNKYRYQFGRKAFYNKFKDEKIMLPSTKINEPDWDFMENYIKQLPYADKI
ncbi:MAG: N-6 DNA methylase [Proteobacteria bacterium]|nr:N-6 DNA methylase [Pseudomonadota bacterium]